MTLKKIDADTLQLGMYVVMPSSWDSHPFLKNKFRLTSKEQIDKIIEAGFTDILIDTEKGIPSGHPPSRPVKKTKE